MRFICPLLFLVHCSLFAQLTPPPYKALSQSERWQRYWKDTILSPGLYFAALGAGSGAQLGNDPPEWGQGLRGYGKRSASLLGEFALDATIHQGGAAALGYDPRYLRCDCRGFGRRFGHAIVWTLVTRDAAGRVRPDLPALAGAYGSGMLSIYWYPERYSPLSDGFRVGTQQLGFSAGVNVVREFGPELKRVFRLGR